MSKSYPEGETPQELLITEVMNLRDERDRLRAALLAAVERGRIAGLTEANISDPSSYLIVERAKLEALRDDCSDRFTTFAARLWKSLDELLKPGGGP